MGGDLAVRGEWIAALPARIIGLEDRGVLRVGAFADIVVFDPREIEMRGDFRDPSRPPGGMRHVLINGQMAYTNGVHTGARPGRVLRH